ncbi:MAG TPA: TAXI family TRAP transporter solute-binding subunit [Afifellaceae bacterium]|nr:TAXI family TRAP transporter solute-binding subunit [Afifellaceae bacterium]
MYRLLTTAMGGAAMALALGLADATPAAAQTTEIRWATSQVGSSGHRALVALATLLNREMEGYDITVLPTPGAAASVRGFAGGQFDGYYGADIAYHEIDQRGGRYRDFDPEAGQQLVQSMWTFTLEIGLGISAADREQYSGWRDLNGQNVFTGPAPWDTRAALERAMAALDVGHEYLELDNSLAGSALQEGQIEAFSVYTTGGASPAPWVQEAMLTTDVAVLNPSEEEIADLSAAGIEVVRVPTDAFDTDVHVEEAVFVPIFYGFHVGLDVSEEDVYQMLTIVNEHAAELAESDAGFGQLAENVVEMQTRGIQASPESIQIHPGLARFLREQGAWNEAWDSRVAQQG